ncbi:hypothetical protein ES703_84684 [subsurface metagenome]
MLNTLKVRWILKGCPRCGGDLYGDELGFTCLQCGHTEVKNEPDIRAYPVPVGAAGKP